MIVINLELWRIFTVVYQHFPDRKRFFWAATAIGTVASFVGEPLVIQGGMYVNSVNSDGYLDFTKRINAEKLAFTKDYEPEISNYHAQENNINVISTK